MTKPVQLLLPLDVAEDRIRLPADDQEEVVAAMARLLLLALIAEEHGEVEDDLQP